MNSMRSSHLVTLSDADYQEYLTIKAKVERKRQLVADLQLRVQDLRWLLSRFMAGYRARVGTLQIQLEKLELETDEMRFRIHWLLTQETTVGLDERVESQFAEHRERLQTDEFEATRARSDSGEREEEGKSTSEHKEKLRHLYRELAKRFHPDLTDCDKERERRSVMMTEVNAAYEREDLSTLEEMLTRLEWEDAEAKAASWKAKTEALDRENQRLGQVLEKVNRELAELEGSKAYQLRQSVEQAAQQGYDLLEQLCSDLRIEIQERRKLLAKYQIRYGELKAKGVAGNDQ